MILANGAVGLNINTALSCLCAIAYIGYILYEFVLVCMYLLNDFFIKQVNPSNENEH